MQTRNRIFDDISQLMTNAAGVAQGMRDEVETLVRTRLDGYFADRSLVIS